MVMEGARHTFLRLKGSRRLRAHFENHPISLDAAPAGEAFEDSEERRSDDARLIAEPWHGLCGRQSL
jgi:hypothetical protein